MIRLELTQSVSSSVYATSLQMFLPVSSSILLHKRANQIADQTQNGAAIMAEMENVVVRGGPSSHIGGEDTQSHTHTRISKLGRLVQLISHNTNTVENGYCDHNLETKIG